MSRLDCLAMCEVGFHKACSWSNICWSRYCLLAFVQGAFKMASVYNQGLMTRGYETENTPSLSSYPVISLSKTSQLTDETREEAGDNCNVFSKYPGAVLLSHDLKKKIRKLSRGVTSWSCPWPRGLSHLSGNQAVFSVENQDARQLPWELRQISSSRNQRKSIPSWVWICVMLLNCQTQSFMNTRFIPSINARARAIKGRSKD